MIKVGDYIITSIQQQGMIPHGIVYRIYQASKYCFECRSKALKLKKNKHPDNEVMRMLNKCLTEKHSPEYTAVIYRQTGTPANYETYAGVPLSTCRKIRNPMLKRKRCIG